MHLAREDRPTANYKNMLELWDQSQNPLEAMGVKGYARVRTRPLDIRQKRTK